MPRCLFAFLFPLFCIAGCASVDRRVSSELLVRDGVTLYAKGDLSARYRVASLTKLFVAEAALRLAERGAVDLDSCVTNCSRFALAPEYAEVTLRDLMEHRSGLPREPLDPKSLFDWHTALMCGLVGSPLYRGYADDEDFAADLNSSRMRKHLRAREPQYSNFGFALFATALEDAVGKDIATIVREEVTVPLGLSATGFLGEELPGTLTEPCSGKLPWLCRRGSIVPDHPLDRYLKGMGGMVSSVADTEKFMSVCGGRVRHLLAAEKNSEGRMIRYRFGMIYGGGVFYAEDPKTGARYYYYRNETSWAAAGDYDRAFSLFTE